MNSKTTSLRDELAGLVKQLPGRVMRHELFALRRALQKKKNNPERLRAILRRVEQATNAFQQRLQKKPEITLAKDLPVSAHAVQIRQAIKTNQVVIVAGETGSGKTTQLPKICLQAGLGDTGLIGCTQPRRLAAISMATRVAEELGETVGQSVGYTVRFDEYSRKDGFVKFMTDGILLQETRSDRWLNAYDAIIIDEAHERSLNIDFLLGYLKKLAKKRPDLKVIVTSATIDTERFSAHFDDAPVITVAGRNHPVSIEYRPLDEDNPDLNLAIADGLSHIFHLPHKPAGDDVLVFLPGEREIHDALEYLQKKKWPNTEILPLYARLSAPQQKKIFHPGRQRRVILATNIAETSLTVPRIGYVIDTGLARVSRYNPRSKIQGLLTEEISQASANQRAGRCGRLGPGLCLRLYSEDNFANRPEHSDPEIRRTSLASVILQTETLRLGHMDDFPFIDPPEPRQVSDGYQLLRELGAIDTHKALTPIGRQLARLPLDVQLGRILIAAQNKACVSEVLVITSALSVQDPRERPPEQAAAADAAHNAFVHPDSDFVTYLNLWREIIAKQQQLSRTKFRRWCRTQFLSWRRIQEWQDIHQQLAQLLNIRPGDIATADTLDYRGVHQAILAGFISHVGLHKENGEYHGARNRRFHLFPGSSLTRRKSPPQWVVAAAIVHTSRVFARTVARIEPEWIEAAASHVLTRTVFDPFWSKKRGAVMAYERLTLFGLPIINKRPVQFGEQDPAQAREIFIRDALAGRKLQTRASFYAHNERLFRELEAEEHRVRRQDILIDPDSLAAWYDQRIPAHVCTEKKLRQWLATQPENTLHLTRGDLVQAQAHRPHAEQFPDCLHIRGVEIPLRYHFEPGADDDGITACLNLAWLNALSENDFEWLVPGLLQEKIEHLIRSLPKPKRRALIPVAEYARALAESLSEEQKRKEPGDFYQRLSHHVRRMTGVAVDTDQWGRKTLPAHLSMRFEIDQGNKKIIAAGRDFGALQTRFSRQARQHFKKHSHQLQQINGARDWVFGSLPEKITLDNGLPAWPGLIAQNDAVGLRFFDNPKEAHACHRLGVKQLLFLKLPGFLRQTQRRLPVSLKAETAWRTLDEKHSLASALVDAALEAIITGKPPRNQSAFDHLLDAVRAGLFRQAADHAAAIDKTLSHWYAVWQDIEQAADTLPEVSYQDMIAQLDYLFYPGFLPEVSLDKLACYPRWLRGLSYRLQQACHSPGKDMDKCALIAPHLSVLEQHWHESDTGSAVHDYHSALEDFRLTIFAPHIKPAQKISAKKLQALAQRLFA